MMSTESLQIPQSEWVPKEQVLKDKTLQVYEIEICTRDFWYFALRWIKTKDKFFPGIKRDFPDFLYLRYIFDIVESEKRVVIRKARRMFMTWFFCARLIWKALFRPGQGFALQSKKLDDSKGLLGKNKKEFITYMLEALSPFFYEHLGRVFIGVEEVTFPNGSWIKAVAQGPDQLRQWQLTEWDLDEASKTDDLSGTIGAVIPTLEGEFDQGAAILWSSVREGEFSDIVDDKLGGEGENPNINPVVETLISCGGAGPEHVGLTVQRNPWNKFVSITLGFAADPRKDPCTEEGRKWMEKTRQSIPDLEWQQEYLMNKNAKSATLIIPQFSKKIHLKNFELQPDWTYYEILDLGIGVPTAVLWIGVDIDKNLYIYDTHYRSDLTIKQNSDEIKRHEEKHPYKPWTRIADPDAWRRLYTGETSADLYSKEGLIHIPANNDLNPGIEKVRDYFQRGHTINLLKESGMGDIINDLPSEKKCTIYILPHLQDIVYELEHYKFKKDGKTIRDKHNHLIAALRYLVMAPPIYVGTTFSRSKYRTIESSLTGTKEYVSEIQIREKDRDGDDEYDE